MLPLIWVKLQIQNASKSGFSLQEYKVKSSQSKVNIISQPNDPDAIYTSTVNATLPTTDSYWDLGSILCDSEYAGVCDPLVKLPTQGCSGPGCGAGLWQDVYQRCYDINEHEYDPTIRTNLTFTWPQYLYGRYFSTCSDLIQTQFEINCR